MSIDDEQEKSAIPAPRAPEGQAVGMEAGAETQSAQGGPRAEVIDALLSSLKGAILNSWTLRQGQWTRDYLGRGDRCAVRIGAFTREIAGRLGWPPSRARRHLHRAEKAGLAISYPTRGGCTRWWPLGLAAELLPHTGTCRICGCTDDHACPGGCYWVEPNLCSACSSAELPF